MSEVSILPLSVPEGACFPGTTQGVINFVAKYLEGYLPAGLTGIICSQTTPDPADNDKVWLKLASDNSPIGIYKRFAGFWVRPHPIPPQSGRLEFTINLDLIGVRSLDLDADPGTFVATEFSGPFWEEVTELAGRYALGAGTVPGSGATINETDSGGSDQFTLTEAQLPAHRHTGKAYYAGNGATLPDLSGVQDKFYHENSSHTILSSPPTLFTAAGVLTDETGSGETVTHPGPYRGGRWIRRTARKWHIG